jgi:hypothetical protein
MCVAFVFGCCVLKFSNSNKRSKVQKVWKPPSISSPYLSSLLFFFSPAAAHFPLLPPFLSSYGPNRHPTSPTRSSGPTATAGPLHPLPLSLSLTPRPHASGRLLPPTAAACSPPADHAAASPGFPGLSLSPTELRINAQWSTRAPPPLLPLRKPPHQAPWHSWRPPPPELPHRP